MPFFSFGKKICGSSLSSSPSVVQSKEKAGRILADCEPKKKPSSTPTARDVADAVRVISDANELLTPRIRIPRSAAAIEAAWVLLPNPVLFAYVRACVTTRTTINLCGSGANYADWVANLQKEADANFEIVIEAIVRGAELPASPTVTKVIAEHAAERLRGPHGFEFSDEDALFQKVHVVTCDGKILFPCVVEREALGPLHLPADLPRKIARLTIECSKWKVERGWYVPKFMRKWPRPVTEGGDLSGRVAINKPTKF